MTSTDDDDNQNMSYYATLNKVGYNVEFDVYAFTQSSC